jgi:hypothetical protein
LRRATALAAEIGAKDRRHRRSDVGGPSSMRGEEGDLERAIEIEERALGMWVPGTRQMELAEQYHMHADNFYWLGDYPRALELSRSAAAVGARTAQRRVRSARRRDGGTDPVGDGQIREALIAGQLAIDIARKMAEATTS